VNVAHGVRIIGTRAEGSKKIVPPSKEVMRSLLRAADEDLRIKLLFSASTGARAGEQWAARWHDVDFNQGELRISRRVDIYGEEGSPKSTAGIRTVPLSQQLVSLLKVWRLRSAFSKDNDLIFTSKEGGHTSHEVAVRRQYHPVFEQLKMVRFNWHSLRHFAVSCWIEAGLTPKTVQTFAGHASLQITMDRYGHLFPKDDHQKVMNRIASELF
jgi:integrase